MQPYHKQARKISKLLAEKLGSAAAGVTVGSVELFQGRERPVIILSAVRSSVSHVAEDARHALGFLSNAKRFNVAVTRAQVCYGRGDGCACMCGQRLCLSVPGVRQSLLVVVGNPFILAEDAPWRALLAHAVRHRAYRGVSLPPGFPDGSGDDGRPPPAVGPPPSAAAPAPAPGPDSASASGCFPGPEAGPRGGTPGAICGGASASAVGLTLPFFNRAAAEATAIASVMSGRPPIPPQNAPAIAPAVAGGVTASHDVGPNRTGCSVS